MKKLSILSILLLVLGCSEKIDLVPNSTLSIPTSLLDFENLLDNTNAVMNQTPSLPQISADEYIIPSKEDFLALRNETSRAAYIWDKDIFHGQNQVFDWIIPYKAIFYANNVLQILAKKDIHSNDKMKIIKGWALFARAYSFYSLVSVYSKAYDNTTASTDLGVPIKLSANIDENVPRSSVQDTYNQIIRDAEEASELLQTDIISNKKNRPSKAAAYALLARVFLSMREYDKAEVYVDKSLAIYSKLVDYNTLKVSAASSFDYDSIETIYYSQQIGSLHTEATFSTSIRYALNPVFLNMYSPNDLRLNIYFKLNSVNNYNYKAINGIGYPFTGLATDELYLIKAECLSRRQQTDQAVEILNSLIITRMRTGTFLPIVAKNPNEVLEMILNERMKALIWRGLRWTDIKRLNLEGRHITLSRSLNGEIYTLEPNSPKYILPIPDDEIALSGIQQNLR